MNRSQVRHFLRMPVTFESAGGVLDIFYPDWKMKIAANEKLFRMTCQLWKEAYCHSGEDMTKERSANGGGGASSSCEMTNGIDELDGRNSTSGGVDDGSEIENEKECTSFKWHPFGPFDCDRGYMVRRSSRYT